MRGVVGPIVGVVLPLRKGSRQNLRSPKSMSPPKTTKNKQTKIIMNDSPLNLPIEVP